MKSNDYRPIGLVIGDGGKYGHIPIDTGDGGIDSFKLPPERAQEYYSLIQDMLAEDMRKKMAEWQK